MDFRKKWENRRMEQRDQTQYPSLNGVKKSMIKITKNESYPKNTEYLFHSFGAVPAIIHNGFLHKFPCEQEYDTI